jgi:transcriptional regulator with XRE-family HTH domain
VPIEILTVPQPLTRGQKARLIRIARGLRQFDLAYRADVTPSIVSAFERDVTVYPAARARLMEVYGLGDRND